MLSLAGFFGIVVEINHVLYRLVAVGIIAHVHHLHFPDFVNHLSIVGAVEKWRNGEYAVESVNKRFASTHQADKSRYIVKDAPSVVPRISLREITAPLQGVEW